MNKITLPLSLKNLSSKFPKSFMRSYTGMGALAVALSMPAAVVAQSYNITKIIIDGNVRVETATILSYAGVSRGNLTAGQINDAYQRLNNSGLFQSVEVIPQGNSLVIKVVEAPTINRVTFEGNRRLKDDALRGFISSSPRRVFSPSVAENDAGIIAQAYQENGRLAAQVSPKVIRRSDNRVDLVFEILEGGVTEVEKIGFVGNTDYSDRRLRRVLESKQAGILRSIVQRDTFVADRVEFDKQVLRDFYQSRGYVDFRVTSANAELARQRDGYFLTFNVQEGQQFSFGEISASSDLSEVDVDAFQKILRLRSGRVYSPTLVEYEIARLESLASREGLNFVRVEPRITRNDRDLTLDVEFVLTRGPKIFVERIDIEGNTTTLDRVVRDQFRIAEGDPFNPREIRESAERIRALGFFENADVNAREGSSPDQVVIDVNVEEKPTGSIGFGGSFSTEGGLGVAINFSEQNFLGRGQFLSFDVSTTSDDSKYSLKFTEPKLLGRDLAYDFEIGYSETTRDIAAGTVTTAGYDTIIGVFDTGLTFPVSDNGRLNVHYRFESEKMLNYSGASSILQSETDIGRTTSSALGYRYTYDTKRSDLTPLTRYRFEVGQDFAAFGGDTGFVKTSLRGVAQRKVLSEEVTLRATLEGGALNYFDGDSRAIDRFYMSSDIMRGFEAGGMGPRQGDESLGGNYYAALKLEAEFPLGLPEEYGLRGGVFYDVGSIWGVNDASAPGVVGAGFSDRHVAGVSLFWESPLGPLRFNWSRAIKKETFDVERTFEFTVSTKF